MTIRFKWGSGTTWTGPVANGKLAVKWGSTPVWTRPGKMRVKWGTVWIDTGYEGSPAEPTNFAVNAWSFSTVSLKWSAGTGGVAISSYDVQQRNQAGSVITTKSDTASPSVDFTVAYDTKYQFYIRSKSASGLLSDWVGPIKVQIGHPSTTTTTTETGVRAYSKSATVNAYKDIPVGPTIPTSVHVDRIRYQISANGGFTSILSPYNNREIRARTNTADGILFDWGNPVDVTVSFNYTSNGGVQGMICRGEGWSIFTTGVQRAVGTITVYGDETYTYQVTNTVPGVSNSYW